MWFHIISLAYGFVVHMYGCVFVTVATCMVAIVIILGTKGNAHA